MNIFITGGFGFIGSQLAKHHLAKGDKVWIVDNLITGIKENLQDELNHPHLRYDIDDICTWKNLKEAVEWSDFIYHMAAIVGQKLVIHDPIRTLKVNIYGCERILDILSEVQGDKKFLIASTSSVYGYDSMTNYKEDEPLRVMPDECIQQSYSLSKIINEEMGQTYAHQKGINCLMVRLFNVVGVNQLSSYGMVVPNLVEQALKGVPLTVYGDGQQTRSFNNVFDAISAIDLLMNNPSTKGEIFNVGATREISILDLAKIIIERTKSKSDIQFIPYKEAYGIDFKEIKKRKANIEKLIALTGFKPRYTLEETIDQVIEAKSKREYT